ncbi:MAG: serine incorporator/TMS membrane protein, partial [Olpidium bornovanus]
CCAAGGVARCCFCCVVPLRLSVLTRLAYTVGFVLATTLAFLLKHYLGKAVAPALPAACGPACYGYLAVCRVSLALVLCHAFLMIATVGVRTSRDVRARLHNGFWPLKILVLAGVTAGLFYMQDALLYPYWIAALVFGCLFILLQNVILIDFAHSTVRGGAERWLWKYEQTGNNTYRTLLVGSTAALYLFALGGLVVLYANFTSGGPSCRSTNTWFATASTLLVAAVTVTSVHPAVREKSPTAGLLQAGIVSLYLVYLTASAVNTNPDGCAATAAADRRLASATTAVGVALTFIALGYSAFSAGSSGRGLVRFSSDSLDSPAGGGLGGGADGDDEADGTAYSYAFYHLVFVLAAFYMNDVVNNWASLAEETAGVGVPQMAVDKGRVSMWMKAASSWLVALLYLWTLVAPVLFPDRTFS